MLESVSEIMERIEKQGAAEMLAVTVDAEGTYFLHISNGTDKKSAVMYLVELIHEMLHHESEDEEEL